MRDIEWDPSLEDYAVIPEPAPTRFWDPRSGKYVVREELCKLNQKYRTGTRGRGNAAWLRYKAWFDKLYNQYLDSWEWAELRWEVLNGEKCEICEDEWSQQAHHLTYDRVFDEDARDLQPVCSHCHSSIHGNKW